MGKVNNVIVLSQKPLGDAFFKWWFIFLKPLHNLTDREIDVIASFVKHRYRLSKVISDPKVLDSMTFSEETKKQVRKDCDITLAHFQVIMGKLRKNKVIVDGRINPKLIPNLSPDDKSLQLLISFPIND